MNSKITNVFNRSIVELCMVAIIVLYSLIIITDLAGLDIGLSNALRYAGIVSCAVIAIFAHRRAFDKKDGNLLIGALLLTVLADTFLLFTSWHILGVSIFCLVHLVYIYRYRARFFKHCCILTLIVFALCSIGYFLSVEHMLLLGIIALLYAALFLTSTYSVFTTKSLPKKNKLLACGGMVLFILCDINVVLYNTLPAGMWIYELSAFLIWVFYLPSQLLISLSSIDYGK